MIEDRVLIAADPLALGHLKLPAAKRFEQHIQFRGFDGDGNANVFQIVLNDSRVLARGCATARDTKDNWFRKAHLRSITVRIAKTRFVQKLFRRCRIESIGLTLRVRPRLFRQDGMGNFALAQHKITNHALAIDRVSNGLSYLHVIKRSFGRIECEQIQIRAIELVYAQTWILRQ